MKKIFISAIALIGVVAMMPNEVSAQFRVVKDGKAILVMDEGTPDYIDFDVEKQEDGPLTLEQLMAMTTVTVNKTADGKNGNVVTCSTTAPVSVKWSVPDYNSTAYKRNSVFKMGKGEHKVLLDVLCEDGTKLKAEYTVTCDVETAAKEKIYIYGENPKIEPPFRPVAWVAENMRFSDNESMFWDVKGEKGHLPYLSDDVYFDCKTLIFELTDVSDYCEMKVMNGWWSATYYDHVPIKEQMSSDGKWELPLIEQMANDCARIKGDGKDLDLMLYSGTMTVNSIYYYSYGEAKPAVETAKAVDLGLSVKWANVNVGASSPEQSGDKYAWGEIKTKSTYDEDTYKFSDIDYVGDNKTTLDPEDDAAHVNWGGDWVMPSSGDFDELAQNCTYEWTTQNGVNGYKITGSNGNTIFLPAAGYRSVGDPYDPYDEGSKGYYWSSSIDEGHSYDGRGLYFREGFFNPLDAGGYRCEGQSVRPVCPSAGNTNGHVAVDLGLPSGKLWASCNVGASTPEARGDHFV